MNWLLTKKIESDLKRVKNIHYTWECCEGVPSSYKHYSFALPSNDRQKFNQDPRTVCIKPLEYKDYKPTSSITSLRTKWFLTLSGKFIPTNVQQLIQLGENFSLPIHESNKVKLDFAKNIEVNIKKLPNSTHEYIRNKSIPIIKNLSFWIVETRKDSIHDYINDLKKQASIFLNNNKNILLTRADKGNITVALDKNNYIRDIERIQITRIEITRQ